jgi:cobyrinic acid a,c-diamide synthase
MVSEHRSEERARSGAVGGSVGDSPLTIPRIVVAAAGSGHGKTSVATGLLAALRARGLTVSGHKVGPDYIDPGYHALAAGRPGRNLDPWLVGEERIVPLFLHGATTPTTADIAIIEGVMGLFDGAVGHGSFASTAHVATLLSAPVVLVVDGTAVARSAAALVHGFATFDPSVRIGGVILNRVGSDRHEQILRDAMVEIGIPVLGVLRRQERLATPSRHLGLVPAAERHPEAQTTVAALGEVVGAGVDLSAVLRLAATAPVLDSQADRLGVRDALRIEDDRGVQDSLGVQDDPGVQDSLGYTSENGDIAGPIVAVAGGPAFTFGYAETTEMLTVAGATVVTFDPLRDERLPPGTAGMVIGGGFPEVYAESLSQNENLRREVVRLARTNAPIAAECAGLLYLATALDGHPMCDVLTASAVMSPRLTLGYRDAVALSDSVLASAGTRVRGHEFHRTVCQPRSGRQPAWQWRDGAPEGFVQGNIHASYLHLHWAGLPDTARRFVAACRDSRVPA